MTAFLPVALFAAAAAIALAILALSCLRALAAFGGIRSEAHLCASERNYSLRVSELKRPEPPVRLRLVSSAPRRAAASSYGLRAAA